jgi:hypothetical protein
MMDIRWTAALFLLVMCLSEAIWIRVLLSQNDKLRVQLKAHREMIRKIEEYSKGITQILPRKKGK